ncbi:MAG TPA: caspase family protein [Blastocatellia bacterium]|nr:caspase family protein [Blastocatellia bacterium]
MRSHNSQILLAVLASLTVPLFSAGAAGPDNPRAPFVLELPEFGRTITEPEAHIPTAEVRTLRFLVRKPFSDSINIGKIWASINGEAAGTVLTFNASLQGHVITCDLEKKPRLKLRQGKNVVEITAEDQEKNSYYASYVLIAGGRRADDPTLASGAAIDYVPGGAGQQPPEIYLTEPKGAVRALSINSLKIRVSGLVTESSGKGVSVLIDGKPASLSLAPATRGLIVKPADAAAPGTATAVFAFESTVTLSSNASSVLVEARDGAGSTTRVAIPLRGRQAAVSSEFKGRKFAVIIGISRYKYHDGGLVDLGYADADARAMRDYLQRAEGGGFASADVFYLENENATIGAVRDGLYRFLPKAAPGDLVLVFIAGHGAPDPYAPQNLYFLMHDTKVADMATTALPMRELQEALDVVRAQRAVVFVDACHAAGLSGDKLVATRGLENNLINLYAAKLFKETGRAVLTSSDVNELSQESALWGGGHGIFTLALLEGLSGEADANGDRYVTAGELFAYVRDRVRAETGFHQNPYALPGLNADFTLAVSTK